MCNQPTVIHCGIMFNVVQCVQVRYINSLLHRRRRYVTLRTLFVNTVYGQTFYNRTIYCCCLLSLLNI